jgi:TRAP-type mannitol/chloroaromatic compound transport system substrate-binding protein
MNKWIKVACIAATTTAALTSQSVADNMQMLVGWSPNYPVVEVAQSYADMIAEATQGELSVELRGPETVPPFEQLEPVSAGVFDLLFTHAAYHTGTTGIALGLEATEGEPHVRRDTGAWDLIDAHYQKYNLKLLSLPVSGSEGFLILLKEPIGDDGGLEGRKIRAAPIYQPLIHSLGGTAVILPPAEIYPALERGVVDGAVWPIFGPLQFKWYEVAPYLVTPTFGVVTHQIFMNKSKWDSLSERNQTILLEAGAELEKTTYVTFSDRSESELAEMMAAGAKSTKLGDAQTSSLTRVWRDGVWALASSLTGPEVDSLRTLLIEAGTTD